MSIPLATLPDDELRYVAALAKAWLLVASARAYGFITGGPAIDEERCDEAIALAVERKVLPTPADVDAVLAGIVAEIGARS